MAEATITSSSGVVYHLWSLPEMTTPEPEEKWEFTTLENSLSDGYYSKRLFGSDTGLRSWKLKAPTLAALSVLPNTATDTDGADVSRLDYVLSLYAEWQVNGTPFVYRSNMTGLYHLVGFTDDDLDLQKAKVQLYSTGIGFRQLRILGETVFGEGDFVNKYSASIHGDNSGYSFPGTKFWFQSFANGGWDSALDVVSTANVLVSNGLNGHDYFSLNGTTDLFQTDTTPQTDLVYDLFFVMKMREDTFSNAAGILTDYASNRFIVGTSGDTKFQNLVGGTSQYRKNGILYANTNQQAPMNAWAVCHWRFPGGISATDGNWQIGKDQTTAGTFANLDIASIIPVTGGLLPMWMARELTEHLIVKWGIV